MWQQNLRELSIFVRALGFCFGLLLLGAELCTGELLAITFGVATATPFLIPWSRIRHPTLWRILYLALIVDIGLFVYTMGSIAGDLLWHGNEDALASLLGLFIWAGILVLLLQIPSVWMARFARRVVPVS